MPARTLQAWCLESLGKLPLGRPGGAGGGGGDGGELELVDLLKAYAPLPPAVAARVCTFLSRRGKLGDWTLPVVLGPCTRELDLRECTDVTDAGLQAIAAACTRLSSLDAQLIQQERHGITSDGVEAVVNAAKLSLRALKLARCVLVDDRALITVSRRCVGLKQLDLSGCPLVTDDGVAALSGMRSLQSLNLSKTRLTDTGCHALADGSCSRRLLELHISNCKPVTDAGAIALITECRQLRCFLFHGCPLVTEASRERLTPTSKGQVTWTVAW